jgi:ligand-binding SRPBCC domain-containing protein
MVTHVFHASQWIPASMEKTWDFFSSPGNLALITPPEMKFVVLTNFTGGIFEGMLIDYKLRVSGIPFRWQTQILSVKEPDTFTDVQVKGPYKLWKHTHYFEQGNGGVMMKDEVLYKLPFGIIGNIVHRLLVRKKIEKIFSYRRSMINKIFAK